MTQQSDPSAPAESYPKVQRPKGITLRVLLALSFAGLTSMSALLSGGFITWQYYLSEREAAISSQAFRAESVTKEISDSMSAFVSSMKTSAAYYPLHSGAEIEEHKHHTLTHVLGSFKGLQAVSVVDASGRETHKASRILTASQLAYTDYSGTALWETVGKGENFLGQVSISQATSIPVVYLAVPVRGKSGNPHGAIVAEMSLGFLWHALSKFKLDKGHEAYVIDRQGQLLGHTLLAQVLRGTTLDDQRTETIFSSRQPYAFQETTSLNGRKVISVSVRLDDYGWAVIYEIPVSEVNSPAIRASVISIIVVVIVTISAAAIGTFVATNLTKPLKKLSESASNLVEEDFSIDVPQHGTSEIQVLSSSFQAMSIRLKALLEELSLAKEKAEQQSLLDGLTGLANRRRFDQFLEQEWARGSRTQSPLSVILMDIDYFKPYNDNYGHSAGDDCLKQVANVLARSVGRSSDLVARYGGEEFVCVLPDVDGRGAEIVAEHFRSHIVAEAIPHAFSETANHVTMSFGVATVTPSATASPLELINEADNALYKAKEKGRNAVVLSETFI